MLSRLTLLASLALLTSCANPTQIIVSLDTTAGIPCDLDGLRVTATGAEAMSVNIPITATTQFPISVALNAPSGGGDVTVDVYGTLAGADVLRATSNASFVNGDMVLLDMTLGPADTVASPRTVAGTGLPTFTDLPSPQTQRTCTTCTPADPPVEICNGLDDDCNGMTDEGGVCSTVERYIGEEVGGLVLFSNACSEVSPIQGSVLSSVDNQEAEAPDAITMELTETGFNFEFYGERVERIFVGDNGYVAFGMAPNSVSIPIGGIDSPGSPRPGILAFWERLETRADGVCFGLSDTSPQQLRITWSQACFAGCDAGDRVNVTVTLEEETNEITIAYGDMAATDEPRTRGSGATVGISDGTQNCAASECSLEGLCTGGANAGMPCGFTQMFAGSAQTSLEAFRFRPVVIE